MGNTWTSTRAGDWKFGVLALADYENHWRNRERVNRSVADPETGLDDTLRTTNQVSLTGSLGSAWTTRTSTRCRRPASYLRNTDDEASLTLGNNSNFQQASGDQLRNYRIRFEERELELLQFRGQHIDRRGDARALGDFVPIFGSTASSVDWYDSDADGRHRHPERDASSRREDTSIPDTGDLI